jgi:hypothetical protein
LVRLGKGFEGELAPGERQQPVEGGFSKELSDMRMDHLANLDVDLSAHPSGVDLQNAGISRQTFHLQYIGQPHLPQHAPKSFLRLELRQFGERGEDALPSSGIARLFQEKLRTAVEARIAVGSGIVAGQDDLQQIGELPAEKPQELKPVDDGHVDVDHQEIDRLPLHRGEGGAGTLRRRYLPGCAHKLLRQLGQQPEKVGIVVDEQNACLSATHISQQLCSKLQTRQRK